MNYIDFTIAVSIFLFFFVVVLVFSTNYFTNISGLTKTSEFRSVTQELFNIFFGSKGTPENWNNLNLIPVQLGFIEDLYRIPVLVKENSGYNRINELVSANIIFDENCENKAWNNSVRVFDENVNELALKISNESFCSSQFLKRAKVSWETNLTANQNKKFYIYYSSDNNILASNYTNTFSTVAYWDFDEGSGNYIYDDSGNDHTGILYNTSTICSGGDCPTWVDGKYGKALQFDGSNDYVNVQNMQSLSPAFTVEAWVKPVQYSSYHNDIVSKRNSEGWTLGIGGPYTSPAYQDKLWFIDSNGNAITYSNINVTKNTWSHVVAIYNDTANIARVYINGEDKSAVTYTATSFSQIVGNLTIGKAAMSDDFYFFTGIIDEVRTWNRVLSPEEINASYILGPLSIKSFPEEKLNAISSSKINALKNLNYEEMIKTLSNYKFRIEISE